MTDTAVPSLAEMVETALRGHGDAPAIQQNCVWYDWAWVLAVAERIIALLDRAGIREDEAIAIAPATEPASAAALLGLIMRSRETVMLYAYQAPAALARTALNIGCAAIIAPQNAWEQPMIDAARAAGAVGIAVAVDAQEIVPGTAVDRSIGHRTAAATRALNLLSSGTTGPPKLRPMDYATVQRSMVLESMVQPFGAPPLPFPAVHYSAFGNIAGLYAWLPFVISGRAVIMHEKFSLDAFIDYIKKYRPPFCGMPPSGYRELMERDISPAIFDGLKFMAGGASYFDPELQRAVQKKYGVHILQSYGATEFGGSITLTTPAHIAQFGSEKAMSVGRPISGTGIELRIADPETGAILPPGTAGVLHAKVPRVGPDWIVTSDLGKLDQDGFFYYIGRNDGIISRGGFKVDPEAVKAALLHHPAIYDAIVVGIPDARLGEVPAGVVVVREGHEMPDPAVLKAFLRERLPATFIPVTYKQVDRIAVTATNKPDISAARQIFAGSPENGPSRSDRQMMETGRYV